MTYRSRLPSKRAVKTVNAYAQKQMGSVVTIHRPSQASFDNITGMITAHDTTLVIGPIPARIYNVSGGGVSFLGSGDTVLRTTQISIMEAGSEGVHVNDRVKVVSSSDDAALVDREFQIMDVSLGGVLTANRILSVQAIEPNVFWPSA